MQKVVGDTGFVVALTNRSDPRHGEVAEVYFQQAEIVLHFCRKVINQVIRQNDYEKFGG
jgi:predicted nucleic acid-binding protein